MRDRCGAQIEHFVSRGAKNNGAVRGHGGSIITFSTRTTSHRKQIAGNKQHQRVERKKLHKMQ